MIDPFALKDEMTQAILSNCESVESSVADSAQIEEEIDRFDPSLFHIYKKRLYLSHQKGKFLKKCP